jgi:transposase
MQSFVSAAADDCPAGCPTAWQAAWAALPDNPLMAARFAHLTTRADNRLARQRAAAGGPGA